MGYISEPTRGWRHEVRTVDGGLRFYMGCKHCRNNRCCITREDCQLHCAGPGRHRENPRR